MNLSRRALLISAWAAAAAASAAAVLRPTPAQAALPLPLPGLWPDQADPAGWLVSEKFDGVRGVWNGQALRHRSGRLVRAPGWFTERLPPVALDGELWAGRGRFDRLSGAVRKDHPVDAEWREVRFLVFESSAAPGSFTERARWIGQVVRQAAFTPLIAVEQSRIADRAGLHRRLASTVAQGGEGLVLHRADAAYGTGRSDTLLKLKPHFDDEAVVIGHRGGKGKYSGLLGALLVQAGDGRRFLVGSGLSDAERHAPPAIGSVITYRWRDLTATGLPRFATFVRVHETL